MCRYSVKRKLITSAFTELLTGGGGGGSSVVPSLSDSDPELLSKSLELVDSAALEWAASNELRTHTHTESINQSHSFLNNRRK